MYVCMGCDDSTFGWERYVGREGAKIGMTTFGASAPFSALQGYFKFTPEHIIEAAKQQLENAKEGYLNKNHQLSLVVPAHAGRYFNGETRLGDTNRRFP